MAHPEDQPHPRVEPIHPQPLSLNNLEQVYSNCVDFSRRSVRLYGDRNRIVTVCYLKGLTRTERLNDYVFRPLAQDAKLANIPKEDVFSMLEQGALYAQMAQRIRTLDEAVLALLEGSCVLFWPGASDALVIPVETEEKRSVGEPDNEPALKGARDSFVESLRTNTALIRRRLHTEKLKVSEQIVGRQSRTAVDVLWLEGIADPNTVEQVQQRLEEIDIDGIEAAGSLEEYLVQCPRTAFPLMAFTQRPDRFCQGLLEGRVGVLCDGLPLGYLLPGTMDQFFKTGQDRAYNWMVVSMLNCVRYLCALVTLLLPGLYIALVTFHPEAIPAKLALSISAAKQEVPFSPVFEVLILLVAFEVIQEAGLRLPTPIGATVSILGGLVVGNAAVDARIVSPAVLVAVAIAGIAGYTTPSQDFGGALRLWRFLLTLMASVAGLFGLSLGCILLVHHLAGLESFGTPYLAPFTADRRRHPRFLRLPLEQMKWRDGARRGANTRNQR